MQALVLNDGQAYLRKRLERDVSRFSIRGLLSEMDSSPNIHIWVFDGRGNKDERRKIYPDYKAGRKPAHESIWTGIELIREALQHTKAIQIETPGTEADDVIAHLAETYAGKLPIFINTVDYDLRALCALHPTVYCSVDSKEGVPDEKIRLYKTWVGDPSDNIPGVKRFGKGSWANSDINELEAVTEAVLSGLDLPATQTIAPISRNWIEENRDLFKAFWSVIGFLPVTDEYVSQNTLVGQSNPSKVNEITGRYWL